MKPLRPSGLPDRLLTAEEVAAWAGVSVRYVLAHARGRNLPVLPSVGRPPKVRRFRPAEVESWFGVGVEA